MNKKTIVASLMTGLILTTALSPILANADTLNAPPKVENTYQSTEQDFINKFDASIKLENGKFVIDYSSLPSSTTTSEIEKLETQINNSNQLISRMSTSDTQVFYSNKYISISSNKLTAYHEGATYVHYYWYGPRIGVSKSAAIKLGKAGINTSTAAGILAGYLGIKSGDAAALCGFIGSAAATFGFVLTHVPGGFVFNVTAGMPGGPAWGFEWQ